jgi:hypothetical protein
MITHSPAQGIIRSVKTNKIAIRAITVYPCNSMKRFLAVFCFVILIDLTVAILDGTGFIRLDSPLVCLPLWLFARMGVQLVGAKSHSGPGRIAIHP